MKWVRLLFFCIFVLAAFAWASPARAQDNTPQALLLTFEGPLTPSMQQYLQRGLRAAQRQGAELLIIQLDTPGGSVDLMNSLVQEMRASTLPIVVYIAPQGAIAGSAGTVITLAAHVAAMAPGTRRSRSGCPASAAALPVRPDPSP